MTLAEEIRKQLESLPPEKQSEVLDFIEFLQQRSGLSRFGKKRSLKKHVAFGSWKHRKINAGCLRHQHLIDALNGVTEADTEYDRYERVLISRITWMEVLIGAEGDDSELRDFLEAHFEIISLDLAVAETAIQLRRAHHIRLPDAIIWATAKANEAVLVTRNTKDF